MSEKKWFGSPKTTCDFCHNEVRDSVSFVDGKTTRGPWAIMCPSCFRRNGLGIGPGLGQQYNGETFIKIGG